MEKHQSFDGISRPKMTASEVMHGRLMRTVTLFSALFAQSIGADDDPNARLRRETRRLGSDEWTQRQAAQEDVLSLLIERSDDEGNLSPEADQVLRIFENGDTDDERIGRIAIIRERLGARKLLLPSRISCPEGTYEDLRQAISTKLGMPIIMSNDSSADQLRTYYPGVRSALTLSSLKDLCDITGCVPTVRPDGITLAIPHTPLDIHVTDKLFTIDDKNGNVSVFYCPDKGVLLNDVNALDVGAFQNVFFHLFLSRESFCVGAPYEEGVLNRALVPFSPVLRAHVAVEPQTQTMNIEDCAMVEIGKQNIYVTDAREMPDGLWNVELSIVLHSHDEDRRCMHQLPEGNTYTIIGKDGQLIQANTQTTSICGNQRTITISCSQYPEQINVRGYSRVITENLPLPREHLPHPAEPTTMEP